MSRVANIAIITGASAGMGKEFVKQVADRYPKLDEIWAIARRKDKLEELAKECKAHVRIMPLDLTQNNDVRILTNALELAKPNVKLLVNCAGCGKVGNFELSSYDEQIRMIHLNCQALTAITYLVLPYMNDCSRIVNLASVAAFLPQPQFAVYAATKSYVLSFSRALQYEIKDRRVSVTAVCPGPVDTEFFDLADPEQKGFAYKKFFMAKAPRVVKKALDDVAYGREISIYGFPMKAVFLLTKILPHHLIMRLIYK